ncbi:MAG: lysophospholipid acyltransferase family protein [Verrucomicrobia bacterium]|nr:lysophospholipid acyltransferase family protein [Verrucomicrobiota bacterium]
MVSRKHRMEYRALRGVAWVMCALPLRVALGLGWLLAVIGYGLAGKRRREVHRRIRQVLGDTVSEAEVRGIAWRAWRNLIFNIIDLIRSSRLTRAEIGRWFDAETAAPLLAWSKQNQGFILAVGHMGNWDLAGVVFSLLGGRLFAMMRRQRNPLIDAYLNELRSACGMGVVERNSRALASVVRRLKKGEALAILPDLRAKSPDGALQVDFLGGKAWVAGGMGLFARHAKVPIVVAITTRDGWVRHRWKTLEPIWPDESLDKDQDIERMTREVMHRLDQAIRSQPDQYFWFNKRWVLEPF